MKTTEYDVGKIQQELSQFLQDKQVADAVGEAIIELKDQLKTPAVNAASISITPKTLSGIKFPKMGQLIRVYGSQPKNKGRVERHPNSFQTLVTIEGAGKTKVFGSPAGFKELSEGNTYWSFVPKNVWHQPVAGEKQWIGVTFHSAPEEVLIDEYKI